MIIYSSTSTKPHLAAYIPAVNVLQLDLSHLKVKNIGMKHTHNWWLNTFSVWQLGKFSCSAALQRSRKQIRQRRIKFWWVQLYVPDAIACKKSVVAKGWFVSVDRSVHAGDSERAMLVACGPKGGHVYVAWWREGFYPHVFDHRFTLQWGNAEPEGVGLPLPNRWGSIGCTHADPV